MPLDKIIAEIDEYLARQEMARDLARCGESPRHTPRGIHQATSQSADAACDGTAFSSDKRTSIEEAQNWHAGKH